MPAGKGLYLHSLNKKNKLLIEPNSVFWGIIKNNGNQNLILPDNIISLYKKVQEKCKQEMFRFRFSSGLTAIYINPTDKCNANCSYCYIPAQIRKQGRSMTEDELEFILNKIHKYFLYKRRKPVIVFHASEPLLVKGILFKLIAKFKHKFYFGIQTNALLLTKKDAAFIKKHKVSIGISLDAPRAQINNLLRPDQEYGGNFKKAIQAISWFKGYKGLNVITTITKFNVSGLPGLVSFLHKKGVQCVLMNPIRLTQKNARKLKPESKIMAKYFIKAIQRALKYSMHSKRRIVIGNFTNTLIGIIAPSARRLMCDISPCGGGRCFFSITANGKMVPCGEFIGLKGFLGGNIFKDSINKAMRSRAFRQIRSRRVEKIPECNICILRNICGAPCPAELHSLGGMYKKSVFCEFYQEIINYAFRLISEEKERYCFRKEGLRNLEFQYYLKGGD